MGFIFLMVINIHSSSALRGQNSTRSLHTHPYGRAIDPQRPDQLFYDILCFSYPDFFTEASGAVNSRPLGRAAGGSALHQADRAAGPAGGNPSAQPRAAKRPAETGP